MALIYHATLENLLPTVGDSELVAGNGAVVNEDHLSLPNYNSGVYPETPIALGSTYTISMWFKDLKDRSGAQGGWMMMDATCDGGGSNGNHGGSVGGYTMSIYTADELGAWDTAWRGSGYTMTQANFTGDWHHIVASFDNGTLTYYIDGAQVGSPVTYAGSSSIEIFGSWLNYNYGFADYMDDIRVYDNALSAGDVSTLFAGGRMQLTDGLVGHWTFDDGDATAAVGGNDGSATEVGFVTSGGRSYAEFAGDGDIVIGDMGMDISEGTIAFWMNSSNIGDYRNILSTNPSGNNNLIRFEQSTTYSDLIVYYGNASTYGAQGLPVTGLTENEWHHVVFSWSGDALLGYLNGVEIFNVTDPAELAKLPSGTINNLVLGRGFSTSSERYYQGFLDDVRVYSRALTGAEIVDLHAETILLPTLSDLLVLRHHAEDTTADVGDAAVTLVNVASEEVDGKSVWSFSGQDSIVRLDEVSDQPDLTGDFSISMWFKGLVSTGTWRTAARCYTADHPILVSFDTDLLGVYDNDSNSFASSGYTMDAANFADWNHITAVGSGNSTKFYINGSLVGEAPAKASGALYAIGNHAWSGDPTLGTQQFADYIDDVCVFSGALTDAQVLEHYNAGADTEAIPETVSLTFLMQDSYGDGWNGSTFQIYDGDSNIVQSHTLAGGYGPESVTITLEPEAYTWAFVSQSYMNEITATLTRDDNSEQLLFSSAGSVLSGAFDLTPPSPVISPTLAASNGEITISAALNAEATTAGATGWAYALTDIFVEGQVHGGTAMAIGADATESPTPHGVHTIYVAAIDDAGLVVVANSADINNTPTIAVEIVKMDTYGDGWNGTMLVITNSEGVEVYNATLTDAEDTANVPVIFPIDLLVGTYSWELQGGTYPEEQEVTIRLASDGTVLAYSAAQSPSSGSFDVAAPGAGDDAGDDGGDDGGDDAVDLTSGLIAKYAFDSDGVDSVGSNDGTNANVTFADGAAQFNGSDARFTLASEPFTASNADYTISVWAMHNNLSSTQRLLGWGDTNGRYFVGYQTARDHIYIGMGDIDIDPTVAYKPVAGQVEHWVFSNSGNTTKFYKDGALVDTVVHGATGAISAGVGMRIGSVYMEFGEYLDGSMDDLRIWDRQLSDAEVTALYDAGAEVAGGAHDWTFGGQLSNIVKMVKGYDVSGSRSFMFLKNAGGDSDVYITPALADFDAYNLMTSGDHGWSGAPVCGEHGPASCFAFGTSDGNLYKVSLSDYGAPDSSSLIHAFGAGSVNSVNYSPTTQEWIVEHDSKVYTIPYAGGAPSLRMTLPAGSKVVDFAPADDAVALTVQLADFTFARYFALIGWATVHDYTGMAAIVEAIGATDFNYDYDIDMWVAAAADGTTVSTDDINNWLL